MRYFVGIDDTDSKFGRCTTFLGYKLILKLTENGCGIPSYPRLVRLNPNVPFKTRGNAAVCIEFETADPGADFERICDVVEEHSDTANGANSGVVLVPGRPPPYFEGLYRRALSELVNKDGVLGSIPALGARVFTLGNGMGVVGASASLGFDPLRDHTYELLAYRRQGAYRTRREADRESVKQMDRATFPHTFNNYDYETGRVMITPHGPDPVLVGIRGDSPGVVLEAFSRVRCSEEGEGHVIYISNQHTDAHLQRPVGFKLKAFASGWLEGRVGRVQTGAGSHVYFELDEGSGSVACAAYEPTGDLRRAARLLRPGDRLRVAGGVRKPSRKHPCLLNVERFEVLCLEKSVRYRNPVCCACGLRMKSEGRNKGFQCPSCKARSSSASVPAEEGRRLRTGIYVSSPRSQRHLTKQLIRYGRELDGVSEPLIDGWIDFRSITPLQAPVQSL